jgi:hypothetical protein
MNEEPFDRVVTAFGMAVLVAGGILALSLIMIVGVNRTRLRCPRCATRMEEKTDWAKAALTLGAAIIARGVAGKIGRGVGERLGDTAGEVARDLASDYFGDVAPRAGDISYLLCPSCHLPKRDDRLGCVAQLGLTIVLPVAGALVVLIGQCSPSEPADTSSPSMPSADSDAAPPSAVSAPVEAGRGSRKAAPSSPIVRANKPIPLPPSTTPTTTTSVQPAPDSPHSGSDTGPALPPDSSLPWL